MDIQRKSGLVILSDYNELDSLYACGGNTTIEPMYRLTYLPAGRSVEYATYVVPVVGLDNVVAATPDYIAGYRMKTDGKGTGTIALSAIRSVHAPAAVSMKVNLMNVKKPSQTAQAGGVSFAALGDQVETKELAFTGAGDDPLVVKVETAAKDAAGTVVAGAFEEYFNGAYQWGENMTVDMVTPVYRGQRPKQKLSLCKPNPLRLKNAPGIQIWYAEGLQDDYYGVTPAAHMTHLGGEGLKADRQDRVFTNYSSNFLTHLSSFPYDYDQLLSYDMLILGGVKQEALGNIGQEMLCDYLAGGGVVMLGGPGAYGASHLRGTSLAEMLPVDHGFHALRPGKTPRRGRQANERGCAATGRPRLVGRPASALHPQGGGEAVGQDRAGSRRSPLPGDRRGGAEQGPRGLCPRRSHGIVSPDGNAVLAVARLEVPDTPTQLVGDETR